MATVSKHDSYPVLSFKKPAVFRTWLKKNHKTSDGLWIKIAKASTGIPTITHMEALDIALCFGWIDGLRRGLDTEYFLQKFTPRVANSTWSLINKGKVARLIQEELMEDAGFAAIEVAKKNGRWNKAYASPKHMTVPRDFQAALNENAKAKTAFATLNAQDRYVILLYLANTTSDVTREKNIRKYIGKLEKMKLKK